MNDSSYVSYSIYNFFLKSKVKGKNKILDKIELKSEDCFSALNNK